MIEDLTAAGGEVMREAEAGYVFDCVREGACCSVVGISNMGKSALLRLIAEPATAMRYLGDATPAHICVLVDCNRMLDLSEQGFYELILRCLLERLATAAGDTTMLGELQSAYEQLIHPASAFDIPLGFNRAMTAVNRQPGHVLVVLFDEFDQVLTGIHGRAFLNLRALHDQYKRKLLYVTATGQVLRQVCSGELSDEFCELFTHHTFFLPPLSERDVRTYALRFAQAEGVTFDETDLRFIHEWAGGHPGLLEATCRALGRITGPVTRDATQDWVIHREVARWLPDELAVRVECRKIWDELSDLEQAALLALGGSEEATVGEGPARLREKHILIGPPDGERFFSRLFAEYIQRLHASRRPGPTPIQVDIESGVVYVEGKQTETLTKLEYRLFLLLYGRRGQIVTKDQVVEAVWGEDYIEQVDDARIEKLVSRLRAKIEPDPKTQRFVNTVRGRGYRLDG